MNTRGEKKEMKPEVLGRRLVKSTTAFLWAVEGWVPAWDLWPGPQAGEFPSKRELIQDRIKESSGKMAPCLLAKLSTQEQIKLFDIHETCSGHPQCTEMPTR